MYRNCVVSLGFTNLGGAWVWRAEKRSGECLDLLTRTSVATLSWDLSHGFEVEADSPADKVLQRLVRDGNAQALTGAPKGAR